MIDLLFDSGFWKMIAVLLAICLIGGTIECCVNNDNYSSKQIMKSDNRLIYDQLVQINSNLVILIELKKGEISGSENK